MNPQAPPPLPYLQGYPPDTLAQVRTLMAGQGLGTWLRKKYSQAHGVRTDRALYDYVQDLKTEHLRGAEPVSKVAFDSKLHVVQNALGTHTTVSRVQGGKLKAKREIRIASLFKETPPEFLKMIVVHELAHLPERQHDKAFYQLCSYMEPAYHQLELEVRLYLMHLDATGARLWSDAPFPHVLDQYTALTPTKFSTTFRPTHKGHYAACRQHQVHLLSEKPCRSNF